MEIHSHGGWKQTTIFSLRSWMWILEFMFYDYGQENQWAKHRWQAAIPADRPHLSCVANHRAFQETFCWHRTYTDPWYEEHFHVWCDSERTFKNSHVSVAQTGQPTAWKFEFCFIQSFQDVINSVSSPWVHIVQALRFHPPVFFPTANIHSHQQSRARATRTLTGTNSPVVASALSFWVCGQALAGNNIQCSWQLSLLLNPLLHHTSGSESGKWPLPILPCKFLMDCPSHPQPVYTLQTGSPSWADFWNHFGGQTVDFGVGGK